MTRELPLWFNVSQHLVWTRCSVNIPVKVESNRTQTKPFRSNLVFFFSCQHFGKNIFFFLEGVAVPEIAFPLKIFIFSSSDFYVQGPHLIIAKHLPAQNAVLFLNHSQKCPVCSFTWRHSFCRGPGPAEGSRSTGFENDQ